MKHSRTQFPVPYRRIIITVVLVLLLALLAQGCGGQTAEEPTAEEGDPASNTTTEQTLSAETEDTDENAATTSGGDSEESAPAEEREEAAAGEAGASEPTLVDEAEVVVSEDDSLPAAGSGATAPDDAAVGGSDRMTGDSETLEEDMPEPGIAPPMPTPAPTANPGGERQALTGAPAPLKAGEIDDNTQFQAYLNYLASYQGPTVRQVDVSERYLITVLDNNQQPLLDATVRIYDEQDQQIFAGRTYAGGQTLFLPGVLGVSPNSNEFRLVAERGNASTETTFARGTQQMVEVAIRDAQPPETLQLDVLFLLDTTGSMSDELERIQQTIDSIAQRIDNFEPRPNLRFAVVAYRDEGEDYVTREYDFTADVDTFREVLSTFEADGGGDTPEALDEALHAAVHDMQWNDDAVRLIFLVADAGPHMNDQQPFNYLTDAQEAVARGLKIYPIAASNTEPDAEYVFRQLAQQTLGRFIFLTYQAGESSGAPGESTTLEAGEQPFTVERLDDLIVQVIERELATALGVQ